MLNTRFSVSLIVIGWLCLSASLCAQPLSFMAPASGLERSCAVGTGGQLGGYAGKSKS
ncbi:hypothetical protein [Enterobacter hormaechei]|uniref:hypothetical protein n=1 Tax=Enterobacter hormaechei TaxID=158836 RepID=UPI001BE0777F|nr:hypothetical protein [Enterobacter hormaechei subsp. xiangfangensis]HAV1851864.1 hypothetical protein [Enterobacter hormaechei subsp. xiangfangensis]